MKLYGSFFLVHELGNILTAPTIVWANNQGATLLAENPKFHKHTKHIDTKFYQIKVVIEPGILLLRYFFNHIYGRRWTYNVSTLEEVLTYFCNIRNGLTFGAD